MHRQRQLRIRVESLDNRRRHDRRPAAGQGEVQRKVVDFLTARNALGTSLEGKVNSVQKRQHRRPLFEMYAGQVTRLLANIRYRNDLRARKKIKCVTVPAFV